MQTNADGTVGKALAVLEEVASFERPVRFSELQGKSEYPKATLYRLLQTLTKQRMLSYDPDSGTYSMGVRLVCLAHAAWRTSSLAPIARPYMDKLSENTGETVHLAQLDHAQVIYVDKRNATQHLPMYSEAGKVGPAYCTGVGKAMMAYLPDDQLAGVLAQQSWHRFTDGTMTDEAALRAELVAIRERGHAYDREEHEPGIICVALPIRNDSGRVLGAISVTSSTLRTSLEKLDTFVPLIRETAHQIARETQNWRFPEIKVTA
ncbi:IclR family transcriptional regulator [Loktanella sp. S4079]|uniref:IclR family transcriptional regulator n=1 Tax=Loktanella sp. S4079 TaxID=579483 RepID=UPI0005F9C46B|nr:IclR family transcriptional regulator [Loktanella sp. S4079]KJZ19015.1 IclR family transcriptional regulator [Loktanella sp. S4079]